MSNGSLLRSTALVLHYANQQLEPLSNETLGDDSDVDRDRHLAFLDRFSLFFIVGDNADAAAVSAQVTQDHINAIYRWIKALAPRHRESPHHLLRRHAGGLCSLQQVRCVL
jgi:hypothetical protein